MFLYKNYQTTVFFIHKKKDEFSKHFQNYFVLVINNIKLLLKRNKIK